MLQPGQFAPNQAWILFKLNQVPISTETDGEFDVIALMDAASLFITPSTKPGQKSCMHRRQCPLPNWQPN